MCPGRAYIEFYRRDDIAKVIKSVNVGIPTCCEDQTRTAEI
jgi:hypothetical protein